MRPPSPAAERLLALLGQRDAPVVGGWVPSQLALDALPPAGTPYLGGPPAAPPPASWVDALYGRTAPASTPPGPSTTVPVPATTVRTPAGDTEEVGEPATSGLPTVRAVLAAGRIDPGRRGVLALAAVGLVAALVAGLVLLRGRPSEQPLTVPPVAGAVASEGTGPQVVVDVAGRVRRPGLVRLPVGSRVDDALTAAGGLVPGASAVGLNRARKLVDGEQVLVGEPSAVPGAAGGAGGLVNLNAATAADLQDLPGIGPVLADRIVEWRTEHGGSFASVDQLREVSGIGESKYAALKSKVTV